MPKAPRTREEVETIKERILDTALQLIIDDGFNNLSMRKIASRLDITATTIYNYYASKDELNLMIYIRGFELLYRMMAECRDEQKEPAKKMEAMIRVYVDFALGFPDYYDIMFNMHTPKYTDYIGTEMEALAWKEKQIALQCIDIFIDAAMELLGPGENPPADEVRYLAIRYWSDLHGIITLCNSGVLYEVDEGAKDLLGRRVDECVASVLQAVAAASAGTRDN